MDFAQAFVTSDTKIDFIVTQMDKFGDSLPGSFSQFQRLLKLVLAISIFYWGSSYSKNFDFQIFCIHLSPFFVKVITFEFHAP